MSPSEDLLSGVLRLAHASSTMLTRIELGAPWGWRRPARDSAQIYVVARGGAVVEVDGVKTPQPLAAGDSVLIPPGRAHALRDRARSPLDMDDARLQRHQREGRPLRAGGNGALTTLVVGCFRFDGPGARRFLDALPPIIHVPGDDGTAAAALGPTLTLLCRESAAPQQGSALVTAHLADVLLVQVLRAHFATGRCGARGWLAALAHPTVGRALALMHGSPEGDWTVASLARAVGQSRSAFAAQFAAVVGETPLHYLTTWRMELAARLLREERLAVAEAAARVGYRGEAAFARSFKRWSGAPPAAYRRQIEAAATR